MHIDPEYTDAFNALIRGEKWWVSLPKDLYEFNDEFTCESQCSVGLNEFSNISIWYSHMLPQIRYVRQEQSSEGSGPKPGLGPARGPCFLEGIISFVDHLSVLSL